MRELTNAERAEVQLLQSQNKMTEEAIVARAKKPTSALHDLFDWDDASAAHKHRLAQARDIIRIYVTVRPVVPENKTVHVNVETAKTSMCAPNASVRQQPADSGVDEVKAVSVVGDYALLTVKLYDAPGQDDWRTIRAPLNTFRPILDALSNRCGQSHLAEVGASC